MLIGLGLALINFIRGLSGDKKKLRKAAIIFVSTLLLIIFISIVEMYVYSH
jgi:hypothetical protein